MPTATFGDVRSALQQPPSPRAWRAVCHLIEQWSDEDDELREVILPYALDVLERWPDELRAASPIWINQLIGDDRPAPVIWKLVRHLEITGARLRVDETKRLVACPHLRGVRHLMVRAALSQSAFGLLMQAPYLTKVTELGFISAGLEDRQFAKFIDAPMMQRGLKRLDLAWSGVAERGVRAIAKAPHLHSLEALDLEGCRELSPDGAWHRLLHSSLLTNLRRLDASKAWLTTEHLRTLGNSPLLAHLTHLDVGYNDIGDRFLSQILTQGEHRPHRLTHLTLWNTSLGGTLPTHLAGTGALKTLEHLDVGNNHFRGADVPTLLREVEMPHLRHLSLRSNALGRSGEALKDCPRCPELTNLNLWSNHLGERGVAALAASDLLGTVETLNLRHNHIDAATLRTLCDKADLSHVKDLDLSVNPLDEEAVDLLATTDALPSLRTLKVLENDLHVHQLDRIRANPHWPDELMVYD